MPRVIFGRLTGFGRNCSSRKVLGQNQFSEFNFTIVEMSLHWKDITSDLFQASKSFKLFEVACPIAYDMEDSMQATEMNDQKVDAKTDLSSKYTLQSLIQSNSIRRPSQISLQELIGVWDQVIGFEVLYMKEYPIAQSIYTFSYMYDRQLCKENPYVLALVDSVNVFGNYFIDLSKQNMSMREDDNTFSLFGFDRTRKSHDEAIEALLKVQKSLESRGKTNEQEKQVAEAVCARVKCRRFLHLLCKDMGLRVQNKNADKVKKSIESFKKRLDEVIKTLQSSKKPEGVFIDTIYKTLRANLSPREIKYPDTVDTYNELRNMVTQIQMFIPVPQTFSQILQKIDELLSLPLNKLSKSYIVSMFFKHKAQYLDSAIPLNTAIGRDIVDWLNLKQNALKSQKYQDFTTQAGTFMNQILLKMFLNRPRWQWETSRIYQNYNYIVHLANEFDATLDNKNQLQVTSYAYYIGINHMIKQLQTGIEIDLYYPEEYGYIFNYIQYLFGIAYKNSMIFIKKFDRGYMDAFDQKTLSNKIKKKVTPNMRKMFASIIFGKALHFYYNAMFKFFFVLINDKVIQQAKNQKERYISRFQIFRKVLFIKGTSYDLYRQQLDKVASDRVATLQSVEDSLKEAQMVLQKLSLLEESDVFSHTRNQLSSLTKLCIKQSLQVMKYKMSKDSVKKVVLTKYAPHYIQVSV